MFRLVRYRMYGVAAAALAVGLSAAVPAGPARAATVPAPPFTECPAIGQAPSCEILLVVNPDGTVSVANDPSVGPFDGSDDTLVGIVNNSQTAVKAVTVDGPGSGLAGFDGDGICSGDYGTWNGSAGCPYGPTGYEGPGTSFVTDPSNLDEAEVDFAGGLAAGGTAYFSLEGALATAQLTARKGGLASFTVTGSDSSALGQAGKQDTGSPKQAKACRTKLGQVKFAASDAIALEALGAFATGGLNVAANNLAQFLSGTGDELDYSDTSTAATEVAASTEFSQENTAIFTYIKQQLANGVTQITPPTGSNGIHTLGFTSLRKEPDLYLAFRYTHSISVTGTGTLSNGSYTGSLVYTIGESYGFNKGNKLLDAGPALRYLQTTCGAPWYPKGAHWFPVTVTVSVPFTIPAPAGSGG